MIVGLVSTFDEGRLAADAVRSLLTCCDAVRVLEGPIGRSDAGGRNGTDWTVFKREGRVVVGHGLWDSDAEKRTALLNLTRRYSRPTWGVIVDADEVLVHGEHLPAVIAYYEAEAAFREMEPLRCPIRLVDPDGTVSVMTGRVLRLDLVDRWVASSYEIKLKNGMVVALGNGKLKGGNEPDSFDLDVTTGLQRRGPLQGEPHVLHRSQLRPPQRQAQRQSQAEKSGWEQLAGSIGGETQDDRVQIWLPT